LATLTRIDLFHVPMELVHGFQTSSHRKNELNHILVRVWDEAGRTGWGECAVPTDPYYCPETTETAWHILRDYLCPAVIGQDLNGAEDLLRRVAKVRGNNFARAGLETAFWALEAERQQKPLAELLSATRQEIISGVSLGIESSIPALVEQVGRFVEEGYRRVKLKIGPGWDVQPVAAVRERWPELPLQVDANSAYTLAPEHITALRELDRFDLLMIEQPLAHDDIIDHARLQTELKTPLCLDESIHSAEDARKALELSACRIINIKTSRSGGLLEAKKVHDLCYEKGIPVWCGGMHEYGVGRAANVALAALPGFTLPGDVSGSDKYYAHDITTEPILAYNGAIRVTWERPGLGYEVDEDYLKQRTVRAISLSSKNKSGWQERNAAWEK
jgi:O-succinylbenzoate synthase